MYFVQLCRINPTARSLSLVLREPECYAFTKYATASAGEPFYIFKLVYHNTPVDETA